MPPPAVLRLARVGYPDPHAIASPDYLTALIGIVIDAGERKRVLACGSGLTTLVLGILGDLNGFTVMALEHDPPARAQIERLLSRHNVKSVALPPVSLTSYGEYEWYDVKAEWVPPFQVVAYDAPPGATRGGRYGLLPVLGTRCRDVVIVLDRASRDSERCVLSRWIDEFGVRIRVGGGPGREYATILTGRG